MDKICGIYCVTNLINGKQYVGLSKDCLKRWSDHYSKSYHSTKEDEIKKPLYMAMRKYGRENFSFNILEECEYEDLKEKEIFWIEKLNTYYNGYNATPGGDLPEGHVLKGEEHGMAKLTEADVVFCRNCYKEGQRSKDIWTKYYQNLITFGGFQRMWHGKTWKHIMPEVFENNPHPQKKITKELVLEIKKMKEQGKTCAEIFHFYNEQYSRTTINDIYNERRYKNI